MVDKLQRGMYVSLEGVSQEQYHLMIAVGELQGFEEFHPIDMKNLCFNSHLLIQGTDMIGCSFEDDEADQLITLSEWIFSNAPAWCDRIVLCLDGRYAWVGITGKAYYLSKGNGIPPKALPLEVNTGITIISRGTTFKEEQSSKEPDLPSVGYTFKFHHEFEEGFEYLSHDTCAWENGDKLEIIATALSDDDGEVFIVLNRESDVLSTAYFTSDSAIFTKPLTEDEQKVKDIMEVLNKVTDDKLKDVFAEGKLFGSKLLAEALVKDGWSKG